MTLPNEPAKSPGQTFLFSEAPVRISASPGAVSDWMVRAATWPSLPSLLLAGLDRDGSCSRMFPVSCPIGQVGRNVRLSRDQKLKVSKTATSRPSSAQWMNSGILAHGQAWTRNFLDWRSGATVCSLSAILATGAIPQRYFLSPKACAGILRRATKRDKKLPAQLERALSAVASASEDERRQPVRSSPGP